MAEDFSVIRRTLSALLTEQHHISQVMHRQVEFAAHQARMLEEQATSSNRQAARIQELIGLMVFFAEGNVETKQRLSALEADVAELKRKTA